MRRQRIVTGTVYKLGLPDPEEPSGYDVGYVSADIYLTKSAATRALNSLSLAAWCTFRGLQRVVPVAIPLSSLADWEIEWAEQEQGFIGLRGSIAARNSPAPRQGPGIGAVKRDDDELL